MKTIRAVSGASGFNLGMNQGAVSGAGVADHIHQHVVFQPQIIERIKHSSDEVNTVNSVVKTMVTHMLSRWGIAADQHRISVDIRVDGVDEWITWIDAKRQPVDYFIVALNAPSDPAIVNFDSPAIIGCNSMEVHAPGGFRMTIVGAETEEA